MELEGCSFPDGLLYDLEHDVWLQESDRPGLWTIGVLASLASFAGKFTSVTYRPIEGTIARGRSIATVESVRFTGAVRLPIDAEVVDRNPELATRPKLLNDSPYGRGWIARLRPTAPLDVADRTLRGAGAIEEEARHKIRELHIRCYPAAPDVELYEIGAECSAVLARLDEELARLAPEDVVLLVTDDPTSPIEMVRWSDRTGESVLMHRREGNLHHFLVRKEATPTPRPRRR